MSQSQKRNIRFHIKELVLDGFSSQDKNRVTSIVQQEMHRLLSQGDLPRRLTQSGDIPHMDGGIIQMEPKATIKNKGSKIARNLYRGLHR